MSLCQESVAFLVKADIKIFIVEIHRPTATGTFISDSIQRE